ncbi:endolytic transglycosylase MltG [uncultured Clostridium sp.]|uniref:endolytic transglycosylase MltG n=1 Tax=uncultured Clostridium sp. TaxID=59620 RepID=UPI0025FEF402|nr:endolytic transglycosylase MltG [uncultured Clostridium sp.]
MKKNGKMKRLKFMILIIAILLSGVFYYNSILNKPLKSDSDTIEIKVREGEAFNSIIEKLDTEGHLRNKFVLKLGIKLSQPNTNLLPGTYEVKEDVSLEKLLEILNTDDANTNQRIVSIPEGYSIDNIAKRLEENNICSKDDFLDAVKKYSLPSYVKENKNKKYNLEGYLFPDTYFFEEGTTADNIIEAMLDNFKSKLEEIEKETGIEVDDKDIESLITKASLVEKETVLDEERPLVASVIENRLTKGMKLQFCSTVNYVVGYDGKELLNNSDINVDSLYNTYKYSGLPVGPITNPGKESIIAALKPAKTDYLYFVLLKGQDGKQHFSTTGEEHERVKKEQGY